jgi:Pentapeptide repeats (8 copies)
LSNYQIEQPDISAPTPERQAELEAEYERQKDTDAPYKDVKIRTLGELQWIMQQRHWSGGVDFQQPDWLPKGMQRANLSGVSLRTVDLSGTTLTSANLSGADLFRANLSHADLYRADMSGVNLRDVNLSGTDLRRAKFDSDTILTGVILSATTKLRDIRWNGVDLTSIEWEQLHQLGDDTDITMRKRAIPPDDKSRANQQLATRLREQGISHHADRFAYRARLWHRRAMRQKGIRGFIPYLGSLFLDLVAGYGYRPGRSFLAYLLVISGFALVYHLFTPHLSGVESVVISMTAFHGRGFFSTAFQPGDPQAIAAALEAFIGLVIEVSFIATFTQRFFSR